MDLHAPRENRSSDGGKGSPPNAAFEAGSPRRASPQLQRRQTRLTKHSPRPSQRHPTADLGFSSSFPRKRVSDDNETDSFYSSCPYPSTKKKPRSHKNSVSTSSDHGITSPLHSPAASPSPIESGVAALFSDTVPASVAKARYGDHLAERSRTVACHVLVREQSVASIVPPSHVASIDIPPNHVEIEPIFTESLDCESYVQCDLSVETDLFSSDLRAVTATSVASTIKASTDPTQDSLSVDVQRSHNGPQAVDQGPAVPLSAPPAGNDSGHNGKSTTTATPAPMPSSASSPLAKSFAASKQIPSQTSPTRPPSQLKSSASTTTPVIFPHASGARSPHSSSRGLRPSSHLPHSAPPSAAIVSPMSPHQNPPQNQMLLPAVAMEQQTSEPAQLPLPNSNSGLGILTTAATPPTKPGGPPSGIPIPATAPPIIKSSSPATLQKGASRGKPPSRSSGIGGPGGGGAFSSPHSSMPPFEPLGGPPRPNSMPPIPPFQRSSSSPNVSARYPGIELQPKTRPITLTQLVNEVKGIYVGLAMVESKCIEIDNEQSNNFDSQNQLEDDQWQALLALHRTLLHEHHDFMLASQHPSASPALRRVAQKYAIPARMWRHGIHSFLELLRHRLPASREHMITFIYMSYSIIALLYETVRAFEDTWVECLGDLSRYRMAIEDDNQRVRDAWTLVSRRWYSLASDRAPTTGRLFHHLAILGRPYIITQMYFYVKSLTVPIPFTSTRESILTLLDPVLNNATQHVPPVELSYIKAHAILFKFDLQRTPEFTAALDHLATDLDSHIALTARDWAHTGVYMGIINSCAFLNYGGDGNVLMKVLHDAMCRSATEGDDGVQAEPSVEKEPTLPSQDTAMADSVNPWVVPAPHASTRKKSDGPAVAEPEILRVMEPVQELVTQIDRTIFARVGDPNCHGYIHARLVWMLCMARLPEGMVYVEQAFPWQELVVALNNMVITCEAIHRIEQDVFMKPQVDKKAEEEQQIREIQLRQQQIQQAAAAEGDNSLFVPTDPPNVDIPPPPPPRRDEDKPLPDDYFLRGLLWSEYYFPPGWFANMESVDDDARLMETSSTRMMRKQRVLWVAVRLAKFQKWITYDYATHVFAVAEAFRPADGGKGKGRLPSFEDSESDSDAMEEEADAKDRVQKFKRDEVKTDVHDAAMTNASASDTTLDRDDTMEGDSDTVDFEPEDGTRG